MKKLFYLALGICLFSCKQKPVHDKNELDQLAKQYVRLGLTIGQYDGDFVDAYYGPDSLKPATAKAAQFPKDSLLAATKQLMQSLSAFDSTVADSLHHRASWLRNQLIAFERRIRIFSGETGNFDEESKDLYGVVAPHYDEQHFKNLVAKLDSLLPGKGTLNERYQQLANRFIIPKDKLDTVIKTTIAECRKRTLQHYALPKTEDFKLEYVTDKPWGGYNWYKGGFLSLLQINTDLKTYIDYALQVGSHESYPGHHVYNLLLEKNLYQDKGWVEISMYPLYSPQSLIAEGSANYGVAMAFPGEERINFTKNVLLPIAGMDTTGIDLYFKALDLKEELAYVNNEVGRGLLGNTLTEEQAAQWLMDYGLTTKEKALKYLSFVRKYRSYIINYNYGKDLVKNYIESNGGTPGSEKQWELFGKLLSNEVMISELTGNK